MFTIGIDLGTSAVKLLLVDQKGEIVKSETREYPIYYPHDKWSEQNPEDWWNACTDGLRALIADVDKNEIAGIGAGGQMHGLVILDEFDNVIRPAILWNDGRTEEETRYLNEVVGRDVLAKFTGNVAFAGFTAPKIMWLKKHEIENFKKIKKIMLPKDYVNYKLTGVFASDYSDAAGTLLLDVNAKRWSEEMLKICDIDIDKMPTLFESADIIGKVCASAALKTGLSENTIVVAGAGDNAAAAIGTGCVKEGDCNISLGTSGTIFIPSDNYLSGEGEKLHFFAHANGKYHLMGCILSAASANKWFCDNVLATNDYQAEQNKIDAEKLGENNVFFLPYLMGERSPINDVAARGVFVGMTAATSRADMVQAVLEGVSFALRDCLEVAKERGVTVKSSTLCGGGAKSELWQIILANVLNIPLDLLATEQGPGYGAALLALCACGVYNGIDECVSNLIKYRQRVLPNAELARKYQNRYDIYKKIYPSMKNLFKEMK